MIENREAVIQKNTLTSASVVTCFAESGEAGEMERKMEKDAGVS